MNNNKFTPHSSSHQQRIIAMYLDNGLDLDTTLKILDSTCVRITQGTIQKLESMARLDKGRPAVLLAKISALKSSPCIKGKPMEMLRLMSKEDFRMKEAAKKMCISIDSANKHMASLKQHFDCHTVASVVYRAMKEGFFD